MSSDPIYKQVEALFNGDTQISIYHFALICQPTEYKMEFLFKRESLNQIYIQPYNPYVLLMFEGRISLSPQNFVRHEDRYNQVGVVIDS